MATIDPGAARAVADLAEGRILASIECSASPERVFESLASPEIARWWVRPGVFDTAEWIGDVRRGGRWRSSGIGGGRQYAIEGEFVEVDAPRRLVHTWHLVGTLGVPTTVTYVLEPTGGRTRLTLRHEGFVSREACLATCIGWETSFEALGEILAAGQTARP